MNRNTTQKFTNYASGDKLEIAPIVEGSWDLPKWLATYLKMVRFEVKQIKVLIRRMEVKSISASAKICKTFLNFSDFKKSIRGVFRAHVSLMELVC